MHLKTRNVNTAFRELVQLFDDGRQSSLPVSKRTSRNGLVLVIDEPVTITYTHPMERVLFNSVRDANPFFHLYEALWMLAGRNDVASLAHYNSRISEFSDDGETFNGAYGFRWRCYRGDPDHDQLDVLVNHLKADPTSRRAVLSMWNVEDDLLKVDSSKDVCCNLNVIFSLADGRERSAIKGPFLDMTVTNRSNDLMWGMLGSDYVHFTILHEYMAARLGVQVGLYHHFSNNLHVYCDRSDWKPEELLAVYGGWDDYNPLVGDSYCTSVSWPHKVPLVRDPERFEEELPILLDAFKGEVRGLRPWIDQLSEPFFAKVAAPMFRAYELHKSYRETEKALETCDLIDADDWHRVAKQWLAKRRKK